MSAFSFATLCSRLTNCQSIELNEAINKYQPGSDIYAAALYTLAKAVLLQAEQEVTANLDTAAPLSHVCVNLLTLPGFAEALWARLVARSGGWIICKYIEKQPGQDDKEFQKLNGILNEDETQLDRQTRITGLIQLYFAICIAKTAAPLPTEFRPQRIWIFFARMLGDKRLMRQTMSLAVRVTFIPVKLTPILLPSRPCMQPWKLSQCQPSRYLDGNGPSFSMLLGTSPSIRLLVVRMIWLKQQGYDCSKWPKISSGNLVLGDVRL